MVYKNQQWLYNDLQIKISIMGGKIRAWWIENIFCSKFKNNLIFLNIIF